MQSDTLLIYKHRNDPTDHSYNAIDSIQFINFLKKIMCIKIMIPFLIHLKR